MIEGIVTVAYIDDMFALVPLLVVWAGAARQMTDVHVVNVACGTGHFDCLFRHVVGAAGFTVHHEHSAV